MKFKFRPDRILREQVCDLSEVSGAAVTIQRSPRRKRIGARRWESSVLRLGACLHGLDKYFFCVLVPLPPRRLDCHWRVKVRVRVLRLRVGT